MQGTGSVASTTTQPSAEPTPFTIDDDATRMVGAAASAAEAGLAGLVVTRGPDSWKERTSARSRDVLLDRAGHLPGGRFGVRIEDVVTVTPDDGRRLNNTSHDL